MKLEHRLTRLEKQMKYQLQPLEVVISFFGGGELPNPPTPSNGVKVRYERYQEAVCEQS